MPTKEKVAARITKQLARAAKLRSSALANPKTAADRQSLRVWQSKRLTRTHADLLANPRFKEAAKFFLTDVYSVDDSSSRDVEVERVVPIATKFLSDTGLETAGDAMELDALSESLDAAMVAALGPRVSSLGAADYGQAYRKVGRRRDRVRQINLIEHLGKSLDRLTHQRFVAATLAIMRKPAKLAGLGYLQGFLERGFTAFKKMGNSDEFLTLLVTRERDLLKALFAGDDSLLGE